MIAMLVDAEVTISLSSAPVTGLNLGVAKNEHNSVLLKSVPPGA